MLGAPVQRGVLGAVSHVMTGGAQASVELMVLIARDHSADALTASGGDDSDVPKDERKPLLSV